MRQQSGRTEAHDSSWRKVNAPERRLQTCPSYIRTQQCIST